MRNISFSENEQLFNEAIELKKRLCEVLHEKTKSHNNIRKTGSSERI